MNNTNRSLYWGFGLVALLISFVTYLLTAQPTVPFWDCGEFTAAAVHQQVPHPPGAPLFLMLGKVFHLLPIGDPGWRVNLLSVVSSALSIWLLYFITVRVIRNFFHEDLSDIKNALVVYGAGFVGAMAYAFSDTFWFNAVESEVYAASQLFVTLIVWLMMVWHEHADEPQAERYLLLITYLIGLSIGVHLLSILTIFSIAGLVYVRKYPVSVKGVVLTMIIGVAVFLTLYNGVILRYPALLAGNFWRTESDEWLITNSSFLTVLAVALLAVAAYGVWWARKAERHILALSCSAFLLLMAGYSTYTQLLIRANSNTPMNENKPDDLDKLVSYLGREQYGKAPTWPRRYQQEERFQAAYRRSGPWTPPPYKRVKHSDGTVTTRPDYSNWRTNTAAEYHYLWTYQIDQMYLRYFLWNFSGRVSDVQDAPAAGPFTRANEVRDWNFQTGYEAHFPINFFAIPLLLGLVGMVFHFRKDWKIATIFMILFLFTGVLAAIQQNQQNPQPRERDYFYTASFMVWAMWIGVGAFALLQQMRQNIAASGGILAAVLVAVPLNMAWQGWFIHSRAGNYLAFDYAYNILQSVEQDAIIFTNGDNDTFPVWYLQDVAGVRRDVRIVNLSLGQTTWYVEQLKNRSPWDAKKIPLSFSDESLMVPESDPRALSYDFLPAEEMVADIDPKVMAQFTNDPALLANPQMRWTVTGRQYGGDPNDPNPRYLRGVQHKLVIDIVKQTKLSRPVYFSSSVGDPERTDEFTGLGRFCRLEGLCYRVCPVPQSSVIGVGVNEVVTDASLLDVLPDDVHHTQQHYGMKFRNLANPKVYYDDVHRGYLLNYRNTYYRYASYLMYGSLDTAKAMRVLTTMNTQISPDQFPMDAALERRLMTMFEAGGNDQQAKACAERLVNLANLYIQAPDLAVRERRYDPNFNPEILGAEASVVLGRWAEAANFYRNLMMKVGKDITLLYRVDELDVLKAERSGDLKKALNIARGLQAKYTLTAADEASRAAANMLSGKIDQLERRLGLAPSVLSINNMVGG